MIELNERLECAKNAAIKAGILANKYSENLETLNIDEKANLQDLVSQADREAEDIIVTTLSDAFPDDGFFGEERGEKKSNNNSYWLIDPIDGTANFVRGIPYYCVSITYIKDDKLEIGIIYDPELKEMYTAINGQGAYMNGKKMQVSTLSFDRSISALGRSHRGEINPYIDLVSTLLNKGAEYRRMGAGALSLAHVAVGRFEAYYEEHMYPWDATAGLLLAKEAGANIIPYMNENWREGNVVYAAAPSIDKELKTILS